jgi:hypothetical protein
VQIRFYNEIVCNIINNNITRARSFGYYSLFSNPDYYESFKDELGIVALWSNLIFYGMRFLRPKANSIFSHPRQIQTKAIKILHKSSFMI